MNMDPDIRGITKYWRPGKDDRELLRKRTGGLPKRHVDLFLHGLWSLVSSRRRTRIVGFGTFEWKPCRRRLPTGRTVDTVRVVFKPSRYAKKYNGGRHGDR